MDSKSISSYLEKNVGVSPVAIKKVGGGSINHTYHISCDRSTEFFLKTNKVSGLPGLFEKEKQGLEYLARQDCIRIPKVIWTGIAGDDQLLLMEWINPGSSTQAFWKRFGEQLAGLHHKTRSQSGFHHDNYMGAMEQQNSPCDNWTRFFIDQRLAPQLQIALKQGAVDVEIASRFESLYKKLDSIFNPEPPALLHGDLWNGNFICDRQSTPVLIDPAVYYGHRSIDLAMTTLFGGFDRSFYEAYHYHFPLPVNHKEQWEVCNLYPLLIHLNLFGKTYRESIISVLARFM